MEDDYMSDDGGAPAAPAVEKKEESKSKTALLPLDFFQSEDIQPGKVCCVKVERVLDDQVEVAYDSSKETEAEEEVVEVGETPAEAPADLMA